MPQIKDKVSSFFSWARKGKEPVTVEATRTPEDEDTTTLPATTPAGTSGTSGGGSAGTSGGGASGGGKEATLQQLKQGYGEVVETMQSLRTHLQQQSDRSEKMLELMRDLPAAIRSIPESNRTQTSMLEAIHANLDRQNQTTDQLAEAIASLATASSHQQRSLSSIDTHLVEEHESRGRLGEGVEALNDTLGQVTASNTATRESMGAVVEQTRVNDERMRTMVQRSQKMNTAMLLLCLALAAGALALGGYMAVLVSKVVQQDGNPAMSPTTSYGADAPAGTLGQRLPDQLVTPPPAADSSIPEARVTPNTDGETAASPFSSNAYITEPQLSIPATPEDVPTDAVESSAPAE